MPRETAVIFDVILLLQQYSTCCFLSNDFMVTLHYPWYNMLLWLYDNELMSAM